MKVSRILISALMDAADFYRDEAARAYAEAAFQIGNEVDGDPEPWRISAASLCVKSALLREHILKLRAASE